MIMDMVLAFKRMSKKICDIVAQSWEAANGTCRFLCFVRMLCDFLRWRVYPSKYKTAYDAGVVSIEKLRSAGWGKIDKERFAGECLSRYYSDMIFVKPYTGRMAGYRQIVRSLSQCISVCPMPTIDIKLSGDGGCLA